jgi:hypothetical protein
VATNQLFSGAPNPILLRQCFYWQLLLKINMRPKPQQQNVIAGAKLMNKLKTFFFSRQPILLAGC